MCAASWVAGKRDPMGGTQKEPAAGTQTEPMALKWNRWLTLHGVVICARASWRALGSAGAQTGTQEGGPLGSGLGAGRRRSSPTSPIPQSHSAMPVPQSHSIPLCMHVLLLTKGLEVMVLCEPGIAAIGMTSSCCCHWLWA